MDLFNDGGWAMYPLLVLLIIGFAVAMERLYNLWRAKINAEEFFQHLEEAIKSGGPDKAAQLCSETPGPVASVIHAGLLRLNRGLDHVEKAVENSGAVEMAFLERGMVWLSTVANLAPMIGFLGTVSGMINAFQAIKEAGDVEPSMVAGGISEALITTATGLIVAIPTCGFHRYLSGRADKVFKSVELYCHAFANTLLVRFQSSQQQG